MQTEPAEKQPPGDNPRPKPALRSAGPEKEENTAVSIVPNRRSDPADNHLLWLPLLAARFHSRGYRSRASPASDKVPARRQPELSS
jgi:hypothetical protein